jgi:hypothetical protein
MKVFAVSVPLAAVDAGCHLFPILAMLHKLWGGQSWPQSAFGAARAG